MRPATSFPTRSVPADPGAARGALRSQGSTGQGAPDRCAPAPRGSLVAPPRGDHSTGARGGGLVEELADRCARLRVDDAKREVLDVPRSAVDETEQRAVDRQAAGVRDPLVPDAEELRLLLEQTRRLAVARDPHRVVVFVGKAHRNRPGGHRHADRPRVVKAGHERPGDLPPNGALIHRPRSSPERSTHHAIRSPSGDANAASTPTGSSLACLRTPVAVSHVHACEMPLSLEMDTHRSGAAGAQ